MASARELDLRYFEQALESEDIRAVKRALEHLIWWHTVYYVPVPHTEVGYTVDGKDPVIQTTELYIQGIENQPGIQKFVRRTSDWIAEEHKPLERWSPPTVICGTVEGSDLEEQGSGA